MLYRDSSDEFTSQVKGIEQRADRCLEHLHLLKSSPHVAYWTILSATVHIIEEDYKRFGPNSPGFRASMINLARHALLLIRRLAENSTAVSPANWIPRWDSSIGAQAFSDLRVIGLYDAFLNTYPMWHRNRYSAELLSNDLVRFTTPEGSRDRQVCAFQKGLRRGRTEQPAAKPLQLDPNEAMLRNYEQVLKGARAVGALGFHYEPHDKLARRTFSAYERRMEQIMRRSEGTSLGPYTLGTFKRFYAALQSICAIHDFLCFRWTELTRSYPIESAVLLKRQQEWIQLLSSQSGIDLPTTEQILRDLTFHSRRLPDLHVFPFVPLDENQHLLALVPQFVLAASPEDNILRTCSYLREKAYSLLSDDKAATMRDDLLETLKRFGRDYSIPLPDGSTEIDLVIEDLQSSTVVIAELKWYRKPSTYRERLQVDEDFEDGYRRQLSKVRNSCRQHPEWLHRRRSLERSLASYENVFYLLIARDYWAWYEPADGTAVVDCDELQLFAMRHISLKEVVQESLKYAWLPVEREDFHVRYESAYVEGIGVESEVYYGGPEPEPP
jgi:hypothetical protein